MTMKPKMLDYSVVVPAFNEAVYLPATLHALKKAMAGIALAGEIIVVDNNSTDGTAAIAARMGARVIFEKINQISRARNRGAAEARGQYLVFLDADTLISGVLLASALEGLKTHRCGGGGATVRPDRPLKPLPRFLLMAWNRLSVRFALAAGSFVYCRKEGFAAVGGFSETVYAGEELWFSMRYRRWGRANGLPFIILAHAPVITSTRKLDWYSKGQTAAMLMTMVFFPLVSRSRKFCRFWYARPPARR
jgi:glycosyltransferase involved in cell wall biosynthesis